MERRAEREATIAEHAAKIAGSEPAPAVQATTA